MLKGETRKKRRFSASLVWPAVVLLFAMCMLSACSGGSGSESAAAPQAPQSGTASQMEALPAGEAANVSGAASSGTAEKAASAQAAPSEAGLGGGIGPIAGAETGLSRKVIYQANVTMKVPDYDQAEAKLRDAIHLSGAYILQFSNSLDESGKAAAYVIKVPADGFSSFIDRLREIQKDLRLQMEGSDVTEEYVDLEARLQAKKMVEARLLAFMDKASGTDDLVRFSSELAAVQEDIEQIKGRMRYLDQNVAYSTVKVRLHEGKAESAIMEDNAGFGERIADAVTGSAKVLGQFGQALVIFLAALLPVAAVVALIGVPVYVVVRNVRRARRELSAERRRQWNGGLMGGEPAERSPNTAEQTKTESNSPQPQEQPDHPE